jgi:hypothetical protein
VRLEGASNTFDGIIVDNCCILKNKLKDIFGPNVIIKLDLFHGIQRIIKQISKRSGNAMVKRLRKQLIKDLRLCFRQLSDVGDERKEMTPSPTIIGASVAKWLAHLPFTSEAAGSNLTKYFLNATRTQSSCEKSKSQRSAESFLPQGKLTGWVR